MELFKKIPKFAKQICVLGHKGAKPHADAVPRTAAGGGANIMEKAFADAWF